MKLLTSISLGALVFGAGNLLADTGSLEGQAFQGSFENVPVGASTSVKFTHTLQFGPGWTVIDNSPTWWGKDAITCTYGFKSKGRGVVLLCNGHATEYKVVQEGDTIQLEGAHATLAKAPL